MTFYEFIKKFYERWLCFYSIRSALYLIVGILAFFAAEKKGERQKTFPLMAQRKEGASRDG